MMLVAWLIAAPIAFVDVAVEVGDGTRIEKTNVVVDNGKIVGIGVAVPPAAKVVTGGVLAPGFIEVRSNLGLVEIEMVKESNDVHAGGAFSPGFFAKDGFDRDSVRFAMVREQGVLTAVAAPSGGIIAGHGALFDLSARPEPVTQWLFAAVGESATRAVGGSRPNVWRKLREVLDDAAFYAKNKKAVDEGRARPLSLPPRELEALRTNERWLVDVERASDIEQLLAFSAEQKLDVAITGGAEAWLVADKLAAAKVPVILLPTGQTPEAMEKRRARDDAAALLSAAKVPLILTASETPNPGRLRQEAGIAVAHGLPREKAITAITLEPARLLGKDKEVGTVAMGKRANLVLWSGDPLELSSRALTVLVGGVEMPLRTRQRALAERYLHVVEPQK